MENRQSKSWFDCDNEGNIVFFSGISERLYKRPLTDDTIAFLNEKLTADYSHIYECDLVALIDYMRQQPIQQTTINRSPRYTCKINRCINIKKELKEVLQQWGKQMNTTLD